MKIHQTKNWLKQYNNLINYKTSYGGEDNRFDPWPGEIQIDNINGKQVKALIRLSVGYKEGDKLIKVLEKILN